MNFADSDLVIEDLLPQDNLSKTSTREELNLFQNHKTSYILFPLCINRIDNSLIIYLRLLCSLKRIKIFGMTCNDFVFSRALFKRTSSILSSTMRSREKYARTPLLFFDVHLVRNLWNSHHRIFSAEQSFGFGSLTCVSKLRRFHHLRRTWECIGMCQDNSGNGK